jgi:5,6-dimethylbenzimidazole synthase
MDKSFSPAERAAVYKVMRLRRDVRRFIPGRIPDDALDRILRAAAHAPSVGYMQPWNFIVIRDAKVRQAVHEAFLRANAEARQMFPAERQDLYASLKLEGILESDLNIAVTCDRRRFGPVVLGRTQQPDMDLFSAVCAVQNLWLAARAEGIGVGWVSILKPEELSAILELPEGVVPVAYLCVGYTERFADEPELKTAGWLPEIPIDDLIYRERWGERSPEARG